MLAHAPVKVQLAAHHGTTVVKQLLHEVMHAEGFGRPGDALADALELGQGQRRVGRVCPLGAQERRPVARVLALVIGEHRLDRAPAVFHVLAVLLDHALAVAASQHALRGEAIRIKLARARVRTDALVHERLRERRGVLLVMAELAKADDVDHDVATELHAEIHRQRRHEHDGFGIVAIDVEHRRLDHLHDIGAVKRGARIARI